ncbi:MAG: disulfide bond formation protein B [Alphaproteobacteria bacterium]|uniref:disulfide bond formation protein B n=1 Tax=Methyloceanibacter sp. TaxID=1965321 RepID=UPI00356809CD
MSADLSKLLNAIGLLAISTVLALALVDQLWFGDLPCPLCILQRAGFFAAGFGIALNLIFGPKPSHYGVAIVGAIAGGSISLRQIVLHIIPGTGHYGNDVFGLHLYTWAFIAFAAIILGCAIMLLDDRQFSRAEPMSVRLKVLPLSALLLFLTLAIANIASTVALCGAGLCPDDPKTYMLLQGG